MARIQKIAPCLRFDDQAEEAAQSDRVMATLLQMKKPEIAAPRRAATG